MLQHQSVINKEKSKCVFFSSNRMRDPIEQIVASNQAIRTHYNSEFGMFKLENNLRKIK